MWLVRHQYEGFLMREDSSGPYLFAEEPTQKQLDDLEKRMVLKHGRFDKYGEPLWIRPIEVDALGPLDRIPECDPYAPARAAARVVTPLVPIKVSGSVKVGE